MEKVSKIFIQSLCFSFVCFIVGIGFFHAETDAAIKSNISFKSITNTTSGVNIKWSNTKKADGYVVYRSENGGKYVKHDTVTKKSYLDEDVSTASTYSYKVKAYKISGKKKKYGKKSSGSASITAKPAGVDLVTVNKSKSSNVLTWDSVGTSSGYYVYRSVDGGAYILVSTIYGDAPNYEDTDIVSSSEYVYKVAAYEYVDGVEYVSVLSAGSIVRMTNVVSGEYGIDVSYHNGVIDWEKVKAAGIDYAMIRLGYGDSSDGGVLDSKFAYNYRQAKKYGVKVGVYFYSYADNRAEAKLEAEYTYKILKQYESKYGQLDYPVAFDFENSYRCKAKYKTSNTKIIKRYCNYLENKGYDTIVYSYYNFFMTATKYRKLEKYGLWLAQWSNTFSPGILRNVAMWQYSDAGSVSGISGRVDRNYTF